MDKEIPSRAPSPAACFLVALSCLLWTTAITLAIVHFLGLTAFAGWLIGISLVITTGMALFLILYEIGHAIDLPDDVELPDFEGIGFSALVGHRLPRQRPALATAGAFF